MNTIKMVFPIDLSLGFMETLFSTSASILAIVLAIIAFTPVMLELTKTDMPDFFDTIESKKKIRRLIALTQTALWLLVLTILLSGVSINLNSKTYTPIIEDTATAFFIVGVLLIATGANSLANYARRFID